MRAARGRPRPGIAQHPAGHGPGRAGAPRQAAVARPDRRAIGVVHRPRPGQGEPAAGGRALHFRDGGGQLPPGRDRGRRVSGPAAGADRRPAARAHQHRRQPGDRPGQAVRQRGALVRPGGPARAAAGDDRLLALAGLPGLGACLGRRGRPAGPGPSQPPLPGSPHPRAPRHPRCAGLARVPGRAGPAGSRGPASRRRARRPAGSSCPGPNAALSSAATATTTRRRSWGWPSRPAGRCSPSRRPGPGRGRTRCPPTSTCSPPRSSRPPTAPTCWCRPAARDSPAPSRPCWPPAPDVTWSSARARDAGPTRSGPPPTSPPAFDCAARRPPPHRGWTPGAGPMTRRAVRWTPSWTLAIS